MQQSPAVSVESLSLPINHSVKALITIMSRFVVFQQPSGCGIMCATALCARLSRSHLFVIVCHCTSLPSSGTSGHWLYTV